MDKITGRTIAFQAAAGETVQFGSLQITERACYTRPATEAPQTTTFVEVDEVDAANQYKRLFSGWMFAASPGLHAVEHPIYDVWLTDCKAPLVATATQVETPPATAEQSAQKPAAPKKPPRASASTPQVPPPAGIPRR